MHVFGKKDFFLKKINTIHLIKIETQYVLCVKLSDTHYDRDKS